MLGKKENLSAQLARQLVNKIISQEYRPGDRIPTEAELCAEYGVSRTVVREAIASIRAEGLLISKQGVGVFVDPVNNSLPFRLGARSTSRLSDVVQILELRLGVEIEAAGLAAERHSKRQLLAIKARLRDMHKELRAVDGDRGRADFEFHSAIARATNNSFFEKFLQFAGPQIIPRQHFGSLRSNREADLRYRANLQIEHADIVDAIASRDVMVAREAMRKHLSASLERYRALYESKGQRGGVSRQKNAKDLRAG